MHGVYAYLPSPQDLDDAGQMEALQALSRRTIDAGAVGLCPLGSSGEVAYVSDEEAQTIVGAVAGAAQGRAAVVPGITGSSTEELDARVRAMDEQGADEIVVVPRPYYAAEGVDWHQLYAELSRDTNAGLVHYSHKGLLGYELDPTTLGELAEGDHLVGVKDAAGVTGRILSIGLASSWRLRVYAGSAHPPMAAHACGAAGWMGGPVCVAPEEAVTLWTALERGDRERAWELQTWFWPLQQAFGRYGIAPFLKAAVALQGFDVGPPRAPLRALDSHELDEIKQLLERPAPTGHSDAEGLGGP